MGESGCRVSRRARAETAAAFGDWGDRDYQAEFGATASASGSVKLGPKLPTAAVPPAKPAAKPVTAAKPATLTFSLSSSLNKALANVATSAKAAAPKPAPVSAPKPAAKPAPAPVVPLKPKPPTPPTPPAAPAVKVAASAAVKPSSGTNVFTSGAKAAAKAPTTLAELAASKQPIKGAAPAPKPTTSAAVKVATPAPKPTSAPKVATTAQSGNFLDGGPALAAPSARPSDKALSSAQADLEKAKAIRAQQDMQAAARATASANLGYGKQRAADAKLDAEIHAWLMANDPAYAAREKSLASAKVDWGLLPGAAKVLALGVGVAATGGALAGALAVPSAASVAGAAVAADRLIASAEKAGVAPKGAGQITGAATLAIDAGTKAKAVLDTTLKLADMGVPEAVAGAKVIKDTIAARITNGTRPGTEQALTPAGSKAFDDFAAELATPAVQGALAVSLLSKRPTIAPIDATRLKAAAAAVANVKASPVVEWFVSAAGKVVQGAGSGKGWLVYSDGRVVKR